MEIRDQIALEAMKIIVGIALTDGAEDYTWKDIAEESYLLADQMLKARSNHEQANV
jgi:hypothetical protein